MWDDTDYCAEGAAEPRKYVKAPSWEKETALEFIHRMTGEPPLKIATFLYLYMCDEIAAGIEKVYDVPERVQQLYSWALRQASSAE